MASIAPWWIVSHADRCERGQDDRRAGVQQSGHEERRRPSGQGGGEWSRGTERDRGGQPGQLSAALRGDRAWGRCHRHSVGAAGPPGKPVATAGCALDPIRVPFPPDRSGRRRPLRRVEVVDDEVIR